FINQAYEKIISKLNNNQSSSMDNITSQVINKFGNNLSQDTLSKDHYLVGLYYSSLKKIPVPKYLTGISNDFSSSSTSTVQANSYNSSSQSYRESVSMYSLLNRRYIFELGSTHDNLKMKKSLYKQIAHMIISLFT
uniref:DUF685 domain-containing protein n=1 Tax=Borrelia persica TaxID=44448 RepID=UPI0004646F7C